VRASHKNPPVIRKLIRYDLAIKVLKKMWHPGCNGLFQSPDKNPPNSTHFKNTRSKTGQKTEIRSGEQRLEVGVALGSVSSRECLNAPAILATFTAGCTGLVACPWCHYNFNNYPDNPHVIWLNFICFFLYRFEKKRNAKVCLKRPPKSVKFQGKDEISLNYAAHSAPQISGGLSLIGQS